MALAGHGRRHSQGGVDPATERQPWPDLERGACSPDDLADAASRMSIRRWCRGTTGLFLGATANRSDLRQVHLNRSSPPSPQYLSSILRRRNGFHGRVATSGMRWLELLQSYSEYAALEPNLRHRLLDAVRTTIDDYGGSFVVNFETVLIAAKRLGFIAAPPWLGAEGTNPRPNVSCGALACDVPAALPATPWCPLTVSSAYLVSRTEELDAYVRGRCHLGHLGALAQNPVDCTENARMASCRRGVGDRGDRSRSEGMGG